MVFIYYSHHVQHAQVNRNRNWKVVYFLLNYWTNYSCVWQVTDWASEGNYNYINLTYERLHHTALIKSNEIIQTVLKPVSKFFGLFYHIIWQLVKKSFIILCHDTFDLPENTSHRSYSTVCVDLTSNWIGSVKTGKKSRCAFLSGNKPCSDFQEFLILKVIVPAWPQSRVLNLLFLVWSSLVNRLIIELE